MKPESLWFVDVFPFPMGPFSGSMLVFRGVMLPSRKLTSLAGESTMNDDVLPSESVDFPMSC